MTNNRGFTEVELLVSLMIFTIGILGGVTLLGAGYRFQGQSRLETELTILAEMKIEELSAMASTNLPDTVALLPGGDLDSDAVGYWDTPSAGSRIFNRRWEVVTGPAGTRQITVRVQALDPPAYGHADLSTTVLHE